MNIGNPHEEAQKFIDNLCADDDENELVLEINDVLYDVCDAVFVTDDDNSDNEEIFEAGYDLGMMSKGRPEDVWYIELMEATLYFVGDESQVFHRIEEKISTI